jgi:hypothetical protein
MYWGEGTCCAASSDDLVHWDPVDNVCFAEGLVVFKPQWFLYYGMADSRIGCAVCPVSEGRSSPSPQYLNQQLIEACKR